MTYASRFVSKLVSGEGATAVTLFLICFTLVWLSIKPWLLRRDAKNEMKNKKKNKENMNETNLDELIKVNEKNSKQETEKSVKAKVGLSEWELMSDATDKKTENSSEAKAKGLAAVKQKASVKKSVRVVNVPTDFGRVRVTIVGDEKSHARMVTYHDVGTNHMSCFGSLGYYLKADELLNMFCVYHVDAPGQEEGATDFEKNYVYPTLPQLAEQLSQVLTHLKVGFFVGMGVGAGADVLMNLAAMPEPQRHIRGLILVGARPRVPSLTDRLAMQGVAKGLRWYGMTHALRESIIGMLLGSRSHATRPLVWEAQQESLTSSLSARNVSMFLDAYAGRGLFPAHAVRSLADTNIPLLFVCGGVRAGVWGYANKSGDKPYTDDIMERMREHNRMLNLTLAHVTGTGRLVTEEAPSELIKPMTSFVESIGYFLPFHE